MKARQRKTRHRSQYQPKSQEAKQEAKPAPYKSRTPSNRAQQARTPAPTAAAISASKPQHGQQSRNAAPPAERRKRSTAARKLDSGSKAPARHSAHTTLKAQDGERTTCQEIRTALEAATRSAPTRRGGDRRKIRSATDRGEICRGNQGSSPKPYHLPRDQDNARSPTRSARAISDQGRQETAPRRDTEHGSSAATPASKPRHTPRQRRQYLPADQGSSPKPYHLPRHEEKPAPILPRAAKHTPP